MQFLGFLLLQDILRDQTELINSEAISIRYYYYCVSILASVSRHENCIFFRSAIHCHLWPVRLYHVFPLLSHERHVFRRKVIQNKVCVLISSTTFVCNSSHSQWDTIINVHDLHVKYQLLLSYFYQICPSGQILKKKILRYQISWKSIQWEHNCPMRTDRHDEANGRFTQFFELI